MAPKTAVFTIVRNESFFLRTWCNYYCSFGWDVCVIDNSTSDNSVLHAKQQHPDIDVIEEPSELAFNHGWLCDVVSKHQKRLLADHDVVVFTEADEILLPSDPNISLGELVETFRQSSVPSIRARGVGVVHQIDDEPQLQLVDGERVLENRHTAFRYNDLRLTPSYDKTLVSKIPTRWSKGFHRARCQLEPSDDLVLLHLQQVDFDVYLQRYRSRQQLKTKESFQGHYDRQQVQKFFRTNKMPWRSNHLMYGDRFDMPEQWATLLRY